VLKEGHLTSHSHPASMSVSPNVSTSGNSKQKTGAVVVPNQPRWYQWLGAFLIVAMVRVVSATLRYKWKDSSGYYDQGPAGPAIYCIWHNRLALCMAAYFDFVAQRNATRGLAAMVSASKDGAFLAAILECFKVHPVRGSSSRRGAQALLELTTWAERGYDLAITPDGPRGPCYEVQDGAVSLAQVTGLPIIPFSIVLKWKLRLNSWDRFQIPLPFSYCEMRTGKPVYVSRNATGEQKDNLRQVLETALRELSGD
jgi:lysophospholipid acyltransferase (LPLAT)-like uncharacterized protein